MTGGNRLEVGVFWKEAQSIDQLRVTKIQDRIQNQQPYSPLHKIHLRPFASAPLSEPITADYPSARTHFARLLLERANTT